MSESGCVHEDLLFSLSGLSLERNVLEERISVVLKIAAERVSILEYEGGSAIFIVYPPEDSSIDERDTIGAEQVTQQINEFIKNGGEAEWLGAECTIVTELEQEVFIDEEEALNMWRDMSDDARTSHLNVVPSPDGHVVLPTHDAAQETEEPALCSHTHAQLKRDPGLLEFDNVTRVDLSNLEAVTWVEPVVITGLAADYDGRLTKDRLVSRYGEEIVRTGNRNTLV